MKSSFGKLGRRFSIHKVDVKERRDRQPSALLEELAQATRDMQDMRNCYDSLLSAAAATANSIYEFSESLQEMGNCLLEKMTSDADGESGKVFSALGNVQSELQKIADKYRSHVIQRITNPSESLLSELRKVEEMKLQCDEKRKVYEYMMTQHRDKGTMKGGKGENINAQKLQEAYDEYDDIARVCVFRVKSLKQGQSRSLFAQAARHHAAQLNFFRRGLKALETVDSSVRVVAEKHRIDYELSELDDREDGDGEGMSSHDTTDDGDLSFEHSQNKQGLVTGFALTNSIELDMVEVPYTRASKLESAEINIRKTQGENFSWQTRVSSYSAPLYPEKIDAAERARETQPTSRKFHSYVLPPPVDAKTSASRATTSLHPLPVNPEKERDIRDDQLLSSSSTSNSQTIAKENYNNRPSSLDEKRQDSTYNTFEGKKVKRHAYSGPLASKPPSTKPISSTSGPINSIEPAQLKNLRPQNLQTALASHSISPPTLTSPKISELHELPRPPVILASKLEVSSGSDKPSIPSLLKNQELSPTNKGAALASSAASPLPLPPLTVPPLSVPRSFSIPSSNQRAMAAHVSKLLDSPQIQGKVEEVASPPLTPISLSNLKSLSPVTGVASGSGQM